MRINEDFLDNIEQEDIASDHISDMSDNSLYPYVFSLDSGEIPKKRKTSFYIQRIERLHHLLISMLERCPAIIDFNHDFVIYIGYCRDEDYNEMVTSQGVTIRWPRWKENPCNTIEEYLDPKVGRSTAIKIKLGLKAKTDTILQIRRLMLSLWKAFSTAFRIAYKTAGYPSSVYMTNQNFTVNCSDNTEKVWTSKNEREHKFFTEAYRAFHPEMKPAQIKPIVDEFTGQDSGLQKALKNFRNDAEWKKKTGRQPYRLKNLVNGAEKVELMNDGRLNFHWSRNEYILDDYMLISPKTRNKEYIISDITDIGYAVCCEAQGVKPGYFKEICGRIMQFCKDVAPEVKNINLSINAYSLKEFINGSVDFRTFAPGMNVKVEDIDEEIRIWSWEMNKKRHFIEQYPMNFDVTITDSYGTKTYHFKKIYKF